MPLTYVLQVLLTLGYAVFGVLAWRTGGHADPNGPFRSAAWRLTGMAFVAHAADRALLNVWQYVALRGGTGSPALEGLLVWQPVFNHSRTFLLIGYCGLLVWLLLRRDLPDRRFWMAVVPVFAAGLLVGGAIGYYEGSLKAVLHYTNVSLLDLVELVVLFGALFTGLSTSRVDRFLWAALGVYAFTLTLNVVFMLALSGTEDPSAWSPPRWVVPAYRSALTLVMVAFAARRLVLARRGTPVPALLESAGSRRPATLFPG